MLHVKGQKLIFIPLNGTKKLRGFTIINSFVDFLIAPSESDYFFIHLVCYLIVEDRRIVEMNLDFPVVFSTGSGGDVTRRFGRRESIMECSPDGIKKGTWLIFPLIVKSC